MLRYEGLLNCLGENTEKYITFSIPIKNDYNNKERYRLGFTDNFRFMKRSLSIDIDNLAEVHNKSCQYKHHNKICEECKTKYKDYRCCFEYS